MAADLALWAAMGAGHVALLLLGLLWASEAPLRKGWRFTFPATMGDVRPLLPFFALYWGIIAVHLVGVQLDPWVTAQVGHDYARDVFGVEGDAVRVFQAVRFPLLDAALFGAYLLGYVFMIYFAPCFYLLHRDVRALRLAAFSFGVLYALTLPFYLFVPISNPWAVVTQAWYIGQPVAFRLAELGPDLVRSYWQFTSPNNELPSLHAAISMLTCLVAWKAGYRRWAQLAAVFAVAIPLASFAMGVHWLLDAVVGELFAVVAVVAGTRLAARTSAAAAAPAPVPAPRAPG